MEIIRVGIYHDDSLFARALAIGLARESRSVRFVLMDDMDTLEELDMVLSSKEDGRPNVVQLVKSQQQKQLETAPYRLYQYEESRTMIDDLLFIYFKMTDRVLEYRGTCKCRLVTFVSDAGGSGTTLTCISTAKMLHSIYGSRLLYLNLCPIDDSKKYLAAGSRIGLLKLLYYLDAGRDFPLESFITRDEEMDYLSTDIVNSSFNDIKPALMTKLVKKVDEQGQYDYFFIDIGSCLSRENKRALENSDLVVFVHRWQNGEPVAYYKHISQEIKKKAGGAKYLFIRNFAGDDWRQEDCEEIWISEDREVVRPDEDEQTLRINLARNYGIEIAAIAKKIVEEL